MNRRIWQPLTFVLAAASAPCGILIACSSERPPPTGTPSITTSTAPERDASPSRPVDAGSYDVDATSSPSLPCLGDSPIVVEGGSPAPVSCPSSPTCSAHCANIGTNFKLGVAQTAVQCINALPSCSDPVEVRSCVDLAMGAACADPTSTGYCQPLVAACDPMAGQPGSNIDQAGCEVFGSALSPAGRVALSDCLTAKIDAGTCPVEVTACGDAIRE